MGESSRKWGTSTGGMECAQISSGLLDGVKTYSNKMGFEFDYEETPQLQWWEVPPRVGTLLWGFNC